jgi:SAM-dependent methyltransferase
VTEASGWYADDEMWERFMPLMFTGRRLAGTPAEVDRITPLLGIEPPAAVLDICCGPGRHSLELSRRGFAVTGVDRTERYLERARAAATAEGLGAEFVEADVRDFAREGTFDAAICMYTSFGYFDDLYDDRRVLANAHRSLRPGGALLIETMGKETVSRRYVERSWFHPEESPEDVFLIENRILGAWERAELHWTVIKPDGRRDQVVMAIRLFSAVELASLLRDAGFGEVTVYGDLDGGAYNADATLLVAVARR